MDWERTLADWSQRYGCKIRKPVQPEILDALQEKIGLFPDGLASFYILCNGLSLSCFNVLPIEDPNNIKHTWAGIERANSSETTPFLEGDPSLLAQFVVFAELDAGKCAAISRQDGSIWYEEADGLNQTSLDLGGFIETCLREVTEL
jgi:hypothetical protein